MDTPSTAAEQVLDRHAHTEAYVTPSTGNRLKQIIAGDTTEYQYDAANRLAQVAGQAYTFDANGNLLQTGVMTNIFDAANRLVETRQDNYTVQPVYNGTGDRVGQQVGPTTTDFALDAANGLAEVIYTSNGNAYLHLPGVIVTESAMGTIRYLLGDGLGSIRQAVDETGAVVAYQEFDPYGNPTRRSAAGGQPSPYSFTGEWWENEVGLLHLRARWYRPETGTFLNRDPLFNTSQYNYASGNPVNRVDPSGYIDLIHCDPITLAGVNYPVVSCRLDSGDSIWGVARTVLAQQGVPNAYDHSNQEVNQYINRVMEPQLKALNPYLAASNAAWNCPACQVNNPSGRLIVPASWIPGTTPPATNPPLPSQQGPVQQQPPIQLGPQQQPAILPPPAPQQGITVKIPSSLKGAYQFAKAVFFSHFQRDDGFIVGGDATFTFAPQSLIGYANPNPQNSVQFRDVCLSANSVIYGYEVVYDFKHQERGIFTYSGNMFNVGTFGGGGVTAYVGKTRGFAKQKYIDGVAAYGGYFAAGDISVTTPVVKGGVTVIEAVPLQQIDNELVINRTGVFATYIGLTGGFSEPYLPPFNADLAVTYYNLLGSEDGRDGLGRYRYMFYREYLWPRQVRDERIEEFKTDPIFSTTTVVN